LFAKNYANTVSHQQRAKILSFKAGSAFTHLDVVPPESWSTQSSPFHLLLATLLMSKHSSTLIISLKKG